MLTSEQLTTWQGRTLVGPGGQAIGTIVNTYEDRRTHEPAWMTVEIPGRGRSELRFVPVEGARATGDDIHGPLDRATVLAAPRAADDGTLTDADQDRLKAHYANPPADPPERSAPAAAGPVVPADADEPEGPTDLRPQTKKETVKRAAKGFKQDNLSDWAAALTYYAVLSIFPGLLALVSLLGVIGSGATDPLLENLQTASPGPAKDIFTDAIQNLQGNSGGAGVLFVFALLGALWSASGYVAAFMRASNAIYEVPEGRPIWKTAPTRLGITVAMLLLLILGAGMVIFTGGLGREAADVVGLSSGFVDVFDIVKWPLLLGVVSMMLAILYYGAPNVRQPGFRWITLGSTVAVVLWIVASALFAVYVANFSSYNETYGTLGGVVAFLTWLWITNLAVLFGAEINAELERSRQIDQGLHPDAEPFVEPRDTQKMDDEEKALFEEPAPEPTGRFARRDQSTT